MRAISARVSVPELIIMMRLASRKKRNQLNDLLRCFVFIVETITRECSDFDELPVGLQEPLEFVDDGSSWLVFNDFEAINRERLVVKKNKSLRLEMKTKILLSNPSRV